MVVLFGVVVRYQTSFKEARPSSIATDISSDDVPGALNTVGSVEDARTFFPDDDDKLNDDDNSSGRVGATYNNNNNNNNNDDVLGKT
jgi:hypothetical protein